MRNIRAINHFTCAPLGLIVTLLFSFQYETNAVKSIPLYSYWLVELNLDLYAVKLSTQFRSQFSTMPRSKTKSRSPSRKALKLVKHDILSSAQMTSPTQSANNNSFELLARNLSFSSDFSANDSVNNNDSAAPDDNDTYKVPVKSNAIVTLVENYNEISINADGQLSTLQGRLSYYYY